MNPHDHINDEVRKTLDILTTMKRARANPYLADKVMRRLMQTKEEPSMFASQTFRFAIAALLVLIGVNVFSILELRTHVEAKQISQATSIEMLATEYRLTVSGYQYEE